MRRKVPKYILGLLVLCTVLVIGFILGDIHEQNLTETAAKTSKVSQSLPTRAELLKLVNAERAKVGVKPLVESPQLDASAQYKASDMAENHYFGHENPKTGKANGLDEILAIDQADNSFKCVYVSENITENIAHHNTAEQAVYSWIKSKPHYKAMVNSKYTLTGFGISGNEIVEHFCQQP